MTGARVAGLVLLLAGAAVGLEATTFEVNFITDPIGPKALPVVVATMLLLTGVHAAARPKSDVVWPSRAVLGKLAAATAAFLAYTLVLDLVGFVLSTTLVVAALSHLYGAPPKRGVAAAALLSVGLWILFVRVLALSLPVGSLWIR